MSKDKPRPASLGTTAAEPASDAPTPLAAKARDRLGDFVLTKKLGEGGMGFVYKAHQQSMDRIVALKVLPKYRARDARFVERFHAEARASAKLDHPNIVRGYAVGEADGFHYFAMEFVDGESCEGLITRCGRVSVGQAVRIAIDVALALEHAHAKNMLHRDIKPANILVSRAGQVKVVDLGLAKALDQDAKLTQTGAGFGTPYYMAPEQARNAKNADVRSDLYSLGASLYHLVTGQLPFPGESALEVLTAQQEGRHLPARRHASDIPEILEVILDKLLAPDPKVRFQTARELIDALEKTGLAVERLSSLGEAEASPPASSSDRSRPESTSAAAIRAKGSGVAGAVEWSIRYTDKRGKPVKARGDTHYVRELIRKGECSPDAVLSKGDPNGPFKPIASFSEFYGLVQSRMIKQRAEKSRGNMAQQFADLDTQEQRRRAWRRRRAIIKRVAGWLVFLAIVGTAAWLGYRYWSGQWPPW